MDIFSWKKSIFPQIPRDSSDICDENACEMRICRVAADFAWGSKRQDCRTHRAEAELNAGVLHGAVTLPDRQRCPRSVPTCLPALKPIDALSAWVTRFLLADKTHHASYRSTNDALAFGPRSDGRRMAANGGRCGTCNQTNGCALLPRWIPDVAAMACQRVVACCEIAQLPMV
jgi:hypothetical protein